MQILGKLSYANKRKFLSDSAFWIIYELSISRRDIIDNIKLY